MTSNLMTPKLTPAMLELIRVYADRIAEHPSESATFIRIFKDRLKNIAPSARAYDEACRVMAERTK